MGDGCKECEGWAKAHGEVIRGYSWCFDLFK